MKDHPALWLTASLAVFYILLGNGRTTSGDGEAMLQVTRALAEHRHLDLAPNILPSVEEILADDRDVQIPYTVTGTNGLTYAKYGLGQSVVALPLYALGMIWRSATGSPSAPRLVAVMLNSLLTAITAGLLLVQTRELGYSTRAGVTIALAYAVCSPAWVYTHTFFSEPLVALCLTAGALGAVRFGQREQRRWLVLMGGALGFAIFTRVNAVAAFPAFGLYLALVWRARKTSTTLIIQQATAVLIALGVGTGLTMLYNFGRFGNPFDFGYRTSNWQAPFYGGLYGMTLSPGKGILWYAPVVILGIAGFRPFARRWSREAWLCAGVSLGYLLLHSTYTHWGGGWSWGPRLLLPALPFMLLPGSAILDQWSERPVVELVLALILVLGLVIQIPAIGGNYAHALQRIYAAWPDQFVTRVLYRPRSSPLIVQWQSFLEVTANLRDPAARAQIADLLAEAEAGDTLKLTDSPAEALRLEQQAILAFNLPDLWLVTAPWLRQEANP